MASNPSADASFTSPDVVINALDNRQCEIDVFDRRDQVVEARTAPSSSQFCPVAVGDKVSMRTKSNGCQHLCTVKQIKNDTQEIILHYEAFDDPFKDKYDERVTWSSTSFSAHMPEALVGKPALDLESSFTDAEDSKFLGVSIAYYVSDFVKEVEEVLGSADHNYYEVNGKLLHGPHGKGCYKECPRDPDDIFPHCSYVDALSNRHKAKATFLLTWFWGLTVTVVASALRNYCLKVGKNVMDVYVWQCAVCNNQFQIERNKSFGHWENFDEFRAMFASRVRTIGRIVALLSPWQAPEIVKRVWCIFEIHMASNPENRIGFEVVLPEHEEQIFADALVSGRAVFQAYESIRIENATATAEDDLKNRMKEIDPEAEHLDTKPIKVKGYDNFTLVGLVASSACHKVNVRAIELLQLQLHTRARFTFHDRAQKGQTVEHILSTFQLLSIQCQQVTDFLNLTTEHRERMLGNGTTDKTEYASLLTNIGQATQIKGRIVEALEIYGDAKKAYEAAGAIATPDYAGLLFSIGTSTSELGRNAEALEIYGDAKKAYEAAGATATPDYASLLRDIAASIGKLGRIAEALEIYGDAKKAYKVAGATATPDYAGLLMSIGAYTSIFGRCAEALEIYGDAKKVYEAAGATATPDYAGLLKSIGASTNKLGRIAEALEIYGDAKKVYEAAGATATPYYASLLKSIAASTSRLGRIAEALEIYGDAKKVYEAAGATAQRIPNVAKN